MSAICPLQIVDDVGAAVEGFWQQTADHHDVVEFCGVAIGFKGLDSDSGTGCDVIGGGAHHGPLAMNLLAVIALVRG